MRMEDIPRIEVTPCISSQEQIKTGFTRTYQKLMEIIKQRFWIDGMEEAFQFTSKVMENHVERRKRTS
jgi:hypothetical protein